MSRKLILLNVVLAALLVWGGIEWRRQYLETKARAAAALHRTPKPAPNPQFVPLPGEPDLRERLPGGGLEKVADLPGCGLDRLTVDEEAVLAPCRYRHEPENTG